MRCGFCGRGAGPSRMMAAGPGLAVCVPCAEAAAAVAGGLRSLEAPPAPGLDRKGWRHGHLDPGALDALTREELLAELGLVREIAAPLLEFIAAATARAVELAGPGAAVELDDAGPGAAPGPNGRPGADPDAEPGPAAGGSRHTHLDDVRLPDGTVVRAASFATVDPYRRRRTPDHALYFDRRWRPPWPHDHVDWPDMGVPADRADTLAALASLLGRARRGQHVELGCLGGHGRTGTALACLAVMAGLDPRDAVGWARSAYCPDAVETDEQAAFVREAFRRRPGRPDRFGGSADPW